MREFQCGDLIGYNSPDEGYIYGIIVGMTETELKAEYPDDSWKSFWVEKEKRIILSRFILMMIQLWIFK